MHRCVRFTFGSLLLLLYAFANAQPISQRPPIEQAKSYTSLIRSSIDICTMSITNMNLAMQLKQLDPANPLGRTLKEVVAELDECAKEQALSLQVVKAQRVDKNSAAIGEECRLSLDELHNATMVFFEHFATDPGEPLPTIERRVKSGASQIRQKSSRTLLICGP